jgi:hypothetical protein
MEKMMKQHLSTGVAALLAVTIACGGRAEPPTPGVYKLASEGTGCDGNVADTSGWPKVATVTVEGDTVTVVDDTQMGQSELKYKRSGRRYVYEYRGTAPVGSATMIFKETRVLTVTGKGTFEIVQDNTEECTGDCEPDKCSRRARVVGSLSM